MIYEVQGAFVNYYEVLGVAENASTATIQEALNRYLEGLQAQMNNPLSMGSARTAMNDVVPQIVHLLLSEDSSRMEYDRQLAASRSKQTAHYEPTDDEGLDDQLRIPFLFNPFEDFDTEIPGYTLRLIAMKLDAEWPDARQWITDTADEIHSFVSYLTFVANRKHLAERIGQIIDAASPIHRQRMDTNEAIERCIDILDPHIERPRVGIHSKSFDGRIFYAGSFVSDLPAQSEIILAHEGVRGCAFGVIKSRTSGVTFENGQSEVRFALMPEGSEPQIGASEVKIPLFFDVANLLHNADHSALLDLCLENQASEVIEPIQVVIHVQPLPPRVVFEPPATADRPVWAGITRRGVPTSVVITARNNGDEELVPLVGRIFTNDNAAQARPGQFHANEPITISIDTTNRPFGQKYTVPFSINYGTPGAQGPTTIYVGGEILPTAWQSLLRERGFGERAGVGCGVGLAGGLLLGALGAGLASHIGIAWLLFLLIPILFVLIGRSIALTTVTHVRRSGDTDADIRHVAPWILWGIPAGAGLAVALVCTLVSDAGTSFWIGGLIGFIVAATPGFLLGKVQAENTGPSPLDT